MKVITFIAGALVASLAAGSAMAQPPTPEQRAARFDAGDKNKDGKLDEAEWLAVLPDPAKAQAETIWGKLDADGDGFVTKEQFLALRMGGAAPGGH